MHRIRVFTLIELLVVIAIIAILAAMLMPALEASRQQAMRSVCVGNLKQQGIAIMMYVHDSDGMLPLKRAGNPRGEWANGAILNELINYAGSPGVWVCPEWHGP
jgi:prepilin-type N-terminal cleavage/methylation domain-containing protein